MKELSNWKRITCLLIGLLCVLLTAQASAQGADLFVGYNTEYTFYIDRKDTGRYELMRIDASGAEESILQASLLTNIQFCDDEYIYIASVDPVCDEENDPLYTQGIRVSCTDGSMEIMPLEQFHAVLEQAKRVYPPEDVMHDVNREVLENAYYGEMQDFSTKDYIFEWHDAGDGYALHCITSDGVSTELLTIDSGEMVMVNYLQDRLYYIVYTWDFSTDEIAYEVGSTDMHGNRETYRAEELIYAPWTVPECVFVTRDWLFLYTAPNRYSYEAQYIDKIHLGGN